MSTNAANSSLPISNRGPLHDLLVLDFTTHLSGPLTTQLLAGLGATVVKIEEPKGDPVRGFPPFVGATGHPTMVPDDAQSMSLPILNRARGKHSITLNLKAPESASVYAELVRRADIVVENYSSGTADRLGVGYEATRAINPRIIYCSISGFGSGVTGRKALDIVIQALSGIALASGVEGGEPVRVGLPVADAITPLFAIMGILAAVHRRHVTGDGEYVDTSMLGALSAFMAIEDWHALASMGPTRAGNTAIGRAPFGIYRCTDGHVAIAGGLRDKFVHALFRAIGMPHLIDDDRYATAAARSQRTNEVNSIVEGWTAKHSKEEAEHLLHEAGIPVAPVRSPMEALNDAQLAARGEVTSVTHPDFGTIPGLKTIGIPVRLHHAECGFGAPAPHLGQHNTAIYCEWLGIPHDQIAAWAKDGVV